MSITLCQLHCAIETKSFVKFRRSIVHWSSDGNLEQILILLDNSSCSEAGKISILVPGAGLGRLAYELARLGYVCQGNEFSMFMLLGSNFILNQ